ncbi:MAG: 23S rRNA (uracil(1939)-C(5))-methyltransferase RlmD [Bacteroidota bacterium]
MRSNKPLPIYQNVEILDSGSEGKSIGRVGEMIVFVPFVVPGDVVDIQVTRKKKNFAEGKAIHFHAYSDKRVEPFCKHFGLCGGCRWQGMGYEHQLYYKQKQVSDAFDRIGKLSYPVLLPIIPSPKIQHYRNKLEYSFSNKKWLVDGPMGQDMGEIDMRGIGFHLPLMFDRILHLDECYLQPEPSNQIRLAVHEIATAAGYDYYDARKYSGLMRNLMVRNTNTGDLMVILVVGSRDMEAINLILGELRIRFPMITSLMYMVNEKSNDSLNDLHAELYDGKPYMEEVMEGLTFRVGPLSFLQVNSAQSLKMYTLTREFADLKGDELVYDLYTGTGTIANFIASKARKVIGIEYVEAAVEDARVNSEINGVKNTEFYAGDMAKLLTAEFFEIHGKPDVIITDPPRNGMHEHVVAQIRAAAPERVVYVSCNPATQARDLALMTEAYVIEIVQPLDMFPHTQHVENVTLLRRRS